jgi:hypothetical protein
MMDKVQKRDASNSAPSSKAFGGNKFVPLHKELFCFVTVQMNTQHFR